MRSCDHPSTNKYTFSGPVRADQLTKLSTTPADLGLLLSLHTVPRVGVEPSLQTQVGLVLSPHGLRRGLGTGASVNQIIRF